MTQPKISTFENSSSTLSPQTTKKLRKLKTKTKVSRLEIVNSNSVDNNNNSTNQHNQSSNIVSPNVSDENVLSKTQEVFFSVKKPLNVSIMKDRGERSQNVDGSIKDNKSIQIPFLPGIPGAQKIEE